MIVVVADYSGYFRTLAKTRTVTDEVSAPLTVGQELLMRLSSIKNLLDLRFGRLTRFDSLLRQNGLICGIRRQNACHCR